MTAALRRQLGALGVLGAAVGAIAIAGCAPGLGGSDPCSGIATCLRLDVDGVLIESIDQLELDVVYGDVHSTITTGTIGTSISVPLSTSIALDVPGNQTIQLSLVAAAKNNGAVVGGAAGNATVGQGQHMTIDLFLEPVSPCTEGALSCGGPAGYSADPETLYHCTGGVPLFYARCDEGCTSFSDNGPGCFGSGLCTDGGHYCGGHMLSGDPHTLYTCMSFRAIDPVPCMNGCAVRGDGSDACQ